MESQIFPRGRHRDKTYQHVLENDKEFCEMVLKGEKSQFIPEDFRDYLLTQAMEISVPRDVIKERGCPHFLKAFSPALTQELKNLLRDIEIDVKQVHPACKYASPNGYSGVFYHFFIKKCVFNVIDDDAGCKYVNNYAAVFPFLVSSEINRCNAEILKIFDADLVEEIQIFLDQHFGDVRFTKIVCTFFANIIDFRSKNFTEVTLSKTLKNMNLEGFSMFDDENNYTECNGNVFSRFHRNDERNDYLKNFPRVNSSGSRVYAEMFDMVANVCNFFQKPFNILPYKYDYKYLTKLPEINFYELYSLLNPEFFRSNRREYIYRLKKYLFFFVHALRSDSKPIFFIDDSLFHCLLSLSTFAKSRDDVFNLKYELAMMTMVYRRKQPLDRSSYYVDDENLNHMKNYILNFPDISNAVVDYEVNTDILESTALISTPNVCMDVCFSRHSRKSLKDFYELIIHGALSPKNVRRLVVYNAYTGEESSIEMPSNKAQLVDFIRTYNKYDFTEQLPPEKFITWGREKYYQGDVARWNSRFGMKK